jgi:hypothetical protein
LTDKLPIYCKTTPFPFGKRCGKFGKSAAQVYLLCGIRNVGMGFLGYYRDNSDRKHGVCVVTQGSVFLVKELIGGKRRKK